MEFDWVELLDHILSFINDRNTYRGLTSQHTQIYKHKKYRNGFGTKYKAPIQSR